jgi:hypothetical protein
MQFITQQEFEELWFSKEDTQWIIYFTAAWCSACKKLDIETIRQKSPLLFYVCDETINDYTAGYCGIRKFPTFALFTPKKILSTLSNNDTAKVCEWMDSVCAPEHTI